MLTELQVNKIGQLCFSELDIFWEIFPKEKLSKAAQWEGIDIIPKGQQYTDQDLYAIQIPIKENALDFENTKLFYNLEEYIPTYDKIECLKKVTNE